MSQQSNYFIGNSGKLMQFDAHKMPIFLEERQIDWVQWGHEKGDREARQWNNLYGDYLIWLYNASAKNNAIINGKNTYIVGEGWGVKHPTELNKQTLDTKLRANAFIGELEDSKITRDLSLDRILFGGFASEMIPNKKGTEGEAHHVDFSKVRVKKKEYHEEGENKGKIKPRIYYYTSDWTSKKPKDNPDFTEFHEFPWDWKSLDKDKKYLVYYKDYRPNLGDYPLPEYIGAIPYIAADYEISNFTYSNVKNGFYGGYMVNFYGGEPSEDQKDQIEARFQETFHGTDQAGKSMLSFNEDKDSGIEVSPLAANGQDDRFINLNDQIRDEIYTGHNFNPTLIGLKNSTGFNNNADELRVASEMLQTTYVTKQQRVFEDFFNALAKLNNVHGEFFIERLMPIQEPVNTTELGEILTINERRELAGFPPIEGQDVLNTSTTFITKKFSKEDDKIVEAFSNCGIEDSELTVLDSREVFAENTKDAEAQSDRFKFESDEAAALLILLNSNPGITKPQLAELTGLTENEINKQMVELENEGLVSNGKPTAKGKKVESKVFVVYKYGLRAGETQKVIDGTRDFCRNLVTLSESRSWTIDDIKLMNNQQGLDVFSSRGGFWNDSGVTHPYCRHIWIQKLVTLK